MLVLPIYEVDIHSHFTVGYALIAIVACIFFFGVGAMFMSSINKAKQSIRLKKLRQKALAASFKKA